MISMKKIFLIFLILNLSVINGNSIEPDVFVQSTVNRASQILFRKHYKRRKN